MLSMSALLRILHLRFGKEQAAKAAHHAEAAISAPPTIKVISQPFDFQPLERSVSAVSARPSGWKRRLSTRRSDATVARVARGKVSQPHYVLRRSTVIFPDMADEKWEAQLYAQQNRSLHSLPVTSVHFSAQVMATPTLPKPVVAPSAPKRQYSMSAPPRRKPVPSLFALDPDVAPLLIPLPPSPALSACMELEDSELPELVV